MDGEEGGNGNGKGSWRYIVRFLSAVSHLLPPSMSHSARKRKQTISLQDQSQRRRRCLKLEGYEVEGKWTGGDGVRDVAVVL